ncbi:DUF4134 family protein [Mucilaginibacter sp. P25]|uniref:DUF4134 family protein n=1 Tax=Mucilaginibacter sp. P25 TaxID=3423945 RepID=UPI003D7A9467
MRRVFCLLCICLLTFSARAQPGISEMEQAKHDLGADFYAAVDLSFVIAGILGITAGLKIYKRIQDGNKDITPEISAWFYAALFMMLSGLFLKALFGI